MHGEGPKITATVGAALYVAALVGVPLGTVAACGAMLCFAVGSFAVVVGAEGMAKQLFTYFAVCVALVVGWPMAVGLARASALIVIPAAMVCVALYIMGARAWREAMEGHAPKPPERPRPRLRADLPPRYEPPKTPAPSNAAFDPFGARRRP